MERLQVRSNWLSGLLVTLMVAAAAAVPLWGRLQSRSSITLHGQMAETGGWTPASLQAQVGQPLHLRLTSDDVMHSFAIGQMDMAPVDVVPGEVSEITLTFDQPGKYTYYCTRWCGANHWRMRGVIEVSGPGPEVQAQESPLYVTLGQDIDLPHPAAVTPAAPPSPLNGQDLLAATPGLVPPQYTTQEYARANSPAEIWLSLRSEPGLQGLADPQIWDLTAALIQAQTTPAILAEGQRLYAQNCAACHGEQGAGDGVMAGLIARDTGMAMSADGPTDFTDPATMLGASPAVLQGKIVRGGMGTGMPYWGPIFTSEQTWALVAYIQSLQFDTKKQP